MNQKYGAIEYIHVSEMEPFPNHPFTVRDDPSMMQLQESIKKMGVLVPLLLRKTGDRYQIIAGHRRRYASSWLGIETLPAIVKDVDEDTATIMMVDSNFQREEILPSERGFAYKMKLEAIKRQEERSKSSAVQVGLQARKKAARDLLAENSPDSSTQIHRYIRLTELIPELLEMVDNKEIALTPAVELSYLTAREQEILLLTIETEQARPSLSQAQRLRRISMEEGLTDDKILEIMMEVKKPDCWNLSFPMDKISRFFPVSYTPRQMQETIFELLEDWKMKGRNI